MGLWARWIHRAEHEGAQTHAPMKTPHQFDWGLEHLGLSGPAITAIREYTAYYTEHSTDYFVPPVIPRTSYTLSANDLCFPSTVQTIDAVNNIVRCRYFPRETATSVILVVPHWNGDGAKYDGLCRFLNRLGHSSIWMSLPFHDRRGDGPPVFDNESALRSTLMVSANIGLTLVAMRQAVQDVISTISWLRLQGYEDIALLGASIGSCAAFLAAAHDDRVKGLFANLMSSYFGGAVWTGISSRHIRRSVERHVGLEDLRSTLLLNSPINFVKALKETNPTLRQCIVSGRFDRTFKYYLTKKIIKEYERHNLLFEHKVLPCGHYTLSSSIFRYIDGFFVWRFFRDLFGT